MTNDRLYRKIASAIGSRLNCIETNNTVWFEKWTEKLESYNELLPHGSGFDVGCIIDLEKSKSNLIVIQTSFHHMDENGGYLCWTDHTVKVKPLLATNFSLYITGNNRNGIKEYMYQLFDFCLDEIIGEWIK